jgi:hypothetical protein
MPVKPVVPKKVPTRPAAALMRELEQATQKSDLAAVLSALEAGADPNYPPLCGGMTPLMVAAQESNPEIVQALLSAGADPNALWQQGVRDTRCVLEMSMEPNNARAGQVARLLVEAGADPWRNGGAPIKEAVQGGRRHALLGMARAGVPLREAPKGQDSLATLLAGIKMTGLIDDFEGELARMQSDEIRQALAPSAAEEDQAPRAGPGPRRI